MSDIFISYKREERPTAERLATALEQQGWSVWWDPDLHAGEHFDDVIEEALEEAECVIVLWSEQSVESRYVRDEATYALSRDKLIPVEIEAADPPFRFERLHTVRLHDWDGSKDSPEFQSLINDIRTKIGPPSASSDDISSEPTVAQQDRIIGDESGIAESQSKVISLVRTTDWRNRELHSNIVVTGLLGFFYLMAISTTCYSPNGVVWSAIVGFPLSAYFIFKKRSYRLAWILAPVTSYYIGRPFGVGYGSLSRTAAFGIEVWTECQFITWGPGIILVIVFIAAAIDHFHFTR